MSRKYRQDPRTVQRQQEALDRELASLWLAPAASPSEPRSTSTDERPPRYADCRTESELLREVGRDGLAFMRRVRAGGL